jgi:hypothetical protein
VEDSQESPGQCNIELTIPRIAEFNTFLLLFQLAHVAFRVLGKFGGGNRKMMVEPQVKMLVS